MTACQYVDLTASPPVACTEKANEKASKKATCLVLPGAVFCDRHLAELTGKERK